MTSKDFIRRIEYWCKWLSAFDLFSQNSGLDHVWKVSVAEVMSCNIDFYLAIPSLPESFFKDYDVSYIVIDRYNRVRFNTDLTFFKSFYSKCSVYQRAVLQQDSRFTNILNYLSNETKKSFEK